MAFWADGQSEDFELFAGEMDPVYDRDFPKIHYSRKYRWYCHHQYDYWQICDPEPGHPNYEEAHKYPYSIHQWSDGYDKGYIYAVNPFGDLLFASTGRDRRQTLHEAMEFVENLVDHYRKMRAMG